MDAKEVVRRMKDFGLKGVRDESAHFFISPELLAEFVQREIVAEREACAHAVERLISGDGICADDGVWIHDCADAIRMRSA